ncbi:50S ribosomal protein L1 [Candidatus Peregrinibacteria bacterium]|jgi:large subunit ribosomal protein L1|nr:50S ribosomal protein L1 [Candidatus Peregrinibacteria bacterium]MBT4148559.1 50S ribosomal protein L1 [Candidatus Peregrinibacteria bacterium]
MAKHGKKYREALEQVESALAGKEVLSVDEAIDLIKKTPATKFDSTCEVHVRLGVNPKHADQNVRSTVSLPHGTGKEVRVIAFVDDAGVKDAKAAGASEAGTNDLIEKIEKGWLDFDVAVADPSQMREISKIAKILGTKGLMPSPKAGTITPDVVNAIEEIKKGKVEFRVDKLANVHTIFGKVSFEGSALKENLLAVVKAILDVRPTTIKGTYLKSITLTTTMGPGVPVDMADAQAQA